MEHHHLFLTPSMKLKMMKLAQSDINFKPLILSIETNYQINLKSFRNFRYTAQWQFQCWQIGLGVDTIWKEINLGISIRNI